MAQRFNRQDRIGVLHYATINVRDHKRIFTRDIYSRPALEVLRNVCNDYPARLIAYVIMPEHLHFIINPFDGKLTRFLTFLKPEVTKAISSVARQLGHPAVLNWLENLEGSEQLWQESKHSFHLFTQRLIWQKINYIHNNPIRRGLVRHAQDYLYSSFNAFYHCGGEEIIAVDTEWWWEELPEGQQ